jgi:four helix bundle protein
MEEQGYFQFEKLVIYQKALDFVDLVYKCSHDFPREEMFGIISQFRRAAVSIVLNIAEGSARSQKDFCRFLDITQGSLFECVAIIEICKRRNYLKEDDHRKHRNGLCELSKMLAGLRKGIINTDTR